MMHDKISMLHENYSKYSKGDNKYKKFICFERKYTSGDYCLNMLYVTDVDIEPNRC